MNNDDFIRAVEVKNLQGELEELREYVRLLSESGKTLGELVQTQYKMIKGLEKNVIKRFEALESDKNG